MKQQGGVKRKIRQQAALDRLQAQLKSGVKTTKEGTIELSKADRIRINKEINILELKLGHKKPAKIEKKEEVYDLFAKK